MANGKHAPAAIGILYLLNAVAGSDLAEAEIEAADEIGRRHDEGLMALGDPHLFLEFQSAGDGDGTAAVQIEHVVGLGVGLEADEGVGRGREVGGDDAQHAIEVVAFAGHQAAGVAEVELECLFVGEAGVLIHAVNEAVAENRTFEVENTRVVGHAVEDDAGIVAKDEAVGGMAQHAVLREGLVFAGCVTSHEKRAG